MDLFALPFFKPAYRLSLSFDGVDDSLCKYRRMQRKREARRRCDLYDDLCHLFSFDAENVIPVKKQLEYTDGQQNCGQDIFRLPVEVTGFDPNEVSVTVSGGKLRIHAKHEKERLGSFVSREFRREMPIPPEVDPNTIVAEMDKDGHLAITAAKKTQKRKQVEEIALKNKHSHEKTLDKKKDDREITVRNVGGVVSSNLLIPVKLSGFNPEEIAVKVKDGYVNVHARHEEEASGSFVSRECRRAFPIPPEVEADSIVAEMNDDGLLCIRALPNISEQKSDNEPCDAEKDGILKEQEQKSTNDISSDS